MRYFTVAVNFEASFPGSTKSYEAHHRFPASGNMDGDSDQTKTPGHTADSAASETPSSCSTCAALMVTVDASGKAARFAVARRIRLRSARDQQAKGSWGGRSGHVWEPERAEATGCRPVDQR